MFQAYTGFYQPHKGMDALPAIATGNWGCGAFRGDLQLKCELIECVMPFI